MLKRLGLGILFTAAMTGGLTASAADSGMSGRWQGWGLWTYGKSPNGTNCNMTMGFSESATEFHRLGGVFDCNVVALYSDPLKWERSGNQLQLNGKLAGKIEPGHVEFTEPVNDQTQAETVVGLTETPQGQRMNYKETWFTTNSDGSRNTVYLIQGEFKRAK